jgi:hypothetical protein
MSFRLVGLPLVTCYDDQFKVNDIVGACGTYRREGKYINTFGRKTVDKRPLGRYRRCWKYDTEMHLS